MIKMIKMINIVMIMQLMHYAWAACPDNTLTARDPWTQTSLTPFTYDYGGSASQFISDSSLIFYSTCSTVAGTNPQ